MKVERQSSKNRYGGDAGSSSMIDSRHGDGKKSSSKNGGDGDADGEQDAE